MKALQKEAAPAGKAPVIPRLPRQESYALSPAQQRLWFLEQFEAGLASFNVPVMFHLAGRLNVPAFKRALAEIVRRHEILRATFATKGEQPAQVIAEAAPPALSFVDLSALPETTRAAEAQRLAAAEAQRIFDLQKGPLYRATLLRLNEAEHVFLLTMHHLVCDGWSIDVFMRELAQLYEAFDAGESSPLEELPIQYTDFAVWSREAKQEKILDEALAYWKPRLAGALPLLELPTDRPRPATQSYRGACEHFKLPANLSEALHALSKSEGATLFTTLLAALQTLLHRYTGQDDIVIGSPVANRRRAEIENLIGFFVNTMVLRTDLSGNPTFRELLARGRETVLGAYAHQELPFAKLVEELRPDRNLSHAPLFQVMFILQSAASLSQFGSLALNTLPAHNGAAKFDLTFDLAPFAGGLSVMLEYNTDLFEAATIKRLAGHFASLLQSIVANPDQRLSELSLLPEAERRQLLVDWNDTQKEYPRGKCLHQLFEAQVERTPDAVALVFEEQHLTYRELNQRANQLAHHLRSLGVGPESRVGVCLERSLGMVAGILGILKAGGAYVPLDPAYPQERLDYILKDAQVQALLTQQLIIDNHQLSIANCQLLCLDNDWETIAAQSSENLKNIADAENPAYVIYTSGSTGAPKGVVGLHRNTVNRLVWMWETLPFAPEEVCCQKTSLNFVDSVWEIFGALLQGIPTRIIPDEALKTPHHLIQTLAEARVTRIVLVPSLLRVILDLPAEFRRLTANLKIWITSGEALPVELCERFAETLPQQVLLNLYGSSEVAADVTWYETSAWNRKLNSVPIGRPIANTQIYLLEASRDAAGIGVTGELLVGGEGLARGYLHRPELTAEKFIPDPLSNKPGARLYKTGDLARYLPDGNIEYLGRRDYQVKIRGFRIELGEIETALAAHPAIAEAVVLARNDHFGELRLVAYFVSKPQLPIAELRQFLLQKLPEYMAPSTFLKLDAMPLLPNGKVDRRSLPVPGRARPELEDGFIAPNTPLEKELAEIWGEILRLEKVGISNNFFAIGGHSLMAMQLLSRLRTRLGVELPVRDFFAAPTIKSLAEKVETTLIAKSSAADIYGMLDFLGGIDEAEAQKLLSLQE